MFHNIRSKLAVGLLVLVAAAVLLAGCAPGTLAPGEAPIETPAGEPAPTGEDPATPPPDEPVSSDDPTPAQPSPETWQPQPGDEDLVREEVEIESSDILTLESFPPQYMLHVTGTKGNPCNMLRVQVEEPDEQNQIVVDIYTLIDPAATCIQMLESYDINIPLGSFEAGEYTVVLNGQEVGEISAP